MKVASIYSSNSQQEGNKNAELFLQCWIYFVLLSLCLCGIDL